MTAALPLALLASDTGAAMLYGGGKVSLNGSALPGSSAIFSGDKIETQENDQARINFAGTNLAIIGDSSLKLEVNAVALNHGFVSVVTSISTIVHDCQITVTPVSNAATEYEVKDFYNRVEISARRSDVTVDDRKQSVTVKEGDQTIREKVCKAVVLNHGGAPPAATYSNLGREIVAAGIIAGTICILLRCDDPISPYTSRGKGCVC